jgi:hypothetical protein
MGKILATCTSSLLHILLWRQTTKPFRLNEYGVFENPLMKAMLDLVIKCLIANEWNPPVTANLFYSLFSVVDVLSLVGPHNWHSKKVNCAATNKHDNAILVMAQASVDYLEDLPPIFEIFQGYFVMGNLSCPRK